MPPPGDSDEACLALTPFYFAARLNLGVLRYGAGQIAQSLRDAAGQRGARDRGPDVLERGENLRRLPRQRRQLQTDRLASDLNVRTLNVYGRGRETA